MNFVSLFSVLCSFGFMNTSHGAVRVRNAPLPPTPRVLSTQNLGVLERESQNFTAPESALQNPIPEMESSGPDGQTPTELKLNESIQQGISGATTVLKSSNDNRYAGEALLQSYAEFLPTLDAGAAYGYSGGKTLTTVAGPSLVDSRNYGPNYSVTTSLNIFNGFADISQLKAKNERKEAADLTLTRVKQEIALDITQTFLQVVLDQDLIEIAKKNLAASQAQLKLISASAEAGIRNKADLYQQQAQIASDENYFTNTQDKKRADLLVLLRKLRLDLHKNYRLVRPELPIDAKANPQFSDESKLVELATQNRPDLSAYRDTYKATEHEIGIASSNYLPKLNLNFGLDGIGRHFDSLSVNGQNLLPANQRSFGTQLTDQVSWTAGLSLTWNILDHGLTRLDTARAQIAADDADIDSGDKEKQVVAEVRQSLGDYRASLQTLASSQSGLVAAQKGYDLVRGRYEVGAANFVDLITAQSILVRAEGARSQAVIGYQLQTKSMETALGTSRF